MQGFSLSGQGSLQAAGVVLCQRLLHDFRRQLSTKGCRVGGQGPGAAALSEGVQVSAGVVYARRNLAIGLQPTGMCFHAPLAPASLLLEWIVCECLHLHGGSQSVSARLPFESKTAFFRGAPPSGRNVFILACRQKKRHNSTKPGKMFSASNTCPEH